LSEVNCVSFVCAFVIVLSFSACSLDGGYASIDDTYSDISPDADRDTDTDTDADADADTAGDSDTDSNTDAGPDTDADSDSDTDTDESFNICGEDVPSEHYVDSIPAYAQCAESQNSDIWSDDGVDTSTERLSSEWIRTQWGAGYQCTEFASRYLKFQWDVMKVPNGNAGTWCDSSPPEGLVQTDTPVHGDIMVFAPGSCWADRVYGHVAVVDIVDEPGNSVEFVEQNSPGRRSCPINTAACFLHAVENVQ
jgi:surface antigen